jgi:hypothetical protein
MYKKTNKTAVNTQQIHWTINAASVEFGLHRATITKRLAAAGIDPAFSDGTFSTTQICRAIFSDKQSEQTRLIAANADLAEIDLDEKRRSLVPISMVERVWNATLADMRNKISYAQIPQNVKEDLVKDLQDVPREEYFNAKAKNDSSRAN